MDPARPVFCPAAAAAAAIARLAKIALASFSSRAAVQGTGPTTQAPGEAVRGQLFRLTGRPGMGPPILLALAAHFNPLGPHPPEPAVSGAGRSRPQNGGGRLQCLYVVLTQARPTSTSLCCCNSAKPPRPIWRWTKGDHDCKTYLAAYCEALQQAPNSRSLAASASGRRAGPRKGAPQVLEQGADPAAWQPRSTRNAPQRWGRLHSGPR